MYTLQVKCTLSGQEQTVQGAAARGSLTLFQKAALLQSPAPTALPHSPLPPNSKLRPPLDLEKKSQLLSTCLHSVLALPLLDVLEKHTCLFLEPPNIQVQSGHMVPLP